MAELFFLDTALNKLQQIFAYMYHMYLSQQEIQEKRLFLGNALKIKGGSDC